MNWASNALAVVALQEPLVGSFCRGQLQRVFTPPGMGGQILP